MISKPNNKVPNVHFIIYSNENTTNLVGLSLKYFDRYIGLDNINITVTSNRYKTEELPFKDKVNYVSADIPFAPSGSHFGQVVKAGLESVSEDYIFYFCEDYILTSQIDIDLLNKLVTLLNDNKFDMFSFGTFQPKLVNEVNKREIFKQFEQSEHYGFKADDLYVMSNKLTYQFSVQPCIWNKKSYLELLKYNPTLHLHHQDTSHIGDKKGKYRVHDPSKGIESYTDWPNKEDAFDYKTLCCNTMIFDYYPNAGNKFIISYVEIIRHGKMTVPGALGHGSGLSDDNWVQKKIYEIIDENDLRNNSSFDMYFNHQPKYF